MMARIRLRLLFALFAVLTVVESAQHIMMWTPEDVEELAKFAVSVKVEDFKISTIANPPRSDTVTDNVRQILKIILSDISESHVKTTKITSNAGTIYLSAKKEGTQVKDYTPAPNGKGKRWLSKAELTCFIFFTIFEQLVKQVHANEAALTHEENIITENVKKAKTKQGLSADYHVWLASEPHVWRRKKAATNPIEEETTNATDNEEVPPTDLPEPTTDSDNAPEVAKPATVTVGGVSTGKAAEARRLKSEQRKRNSKVKLSDLLHEYEQGQRDAKKSWEAEENA